MGWTLLEKQVHTESKGSYMARRWAVSPAMWSVFERDGSRTNNHLEGWHSKFNSIISRPHPNIYQLLHAIREEQAVTELTAVQLEAGSQTPRRKRRYVAVDDRLARLMKAYVDGEKTIDQFVVGVAYNLSTFVWVSHAVYAKWELTKWE